MQKSETPKKEYTAGGKTIPIDPKDKKIERLRGQLDREKYANRQLRQQQFYQSYSSRPVVVYHDPYGSMFWWYLLDRSLEERALWAYHHRRDMDVARYQAMLAKDAQLEARIRQLEREKVARDPNYTLKGMDTDLQYSDDYVQAVYNPVPVVRPASGRGGWIVLWVLLGVASIGLIVWLVFYRKW